MAWSLRFDGVNDSVTIASGMTGNAGLDAYSFRIKSGPNGITLPASSSRFLIGDSGGANGLNVTSGGLIRVFANAGSRYASTSQRIFTGVPFDYTITHNSDGTWSIYNNLTSTQTDSGTFSTSQSWTGASSLSRFLNLVAGDIALIAVTGLVNADTWDANLSGGAGTTLPTVSGTNQGTLVNFTVPDCWVFYDDGGATAATQIKLFDGTAFTNKTIKRWNGSAFVDVTLKRWNGSAFVDL